MIGTIILTQGRRPAELAAALESVREQRGVDVDVVVVGNGWEPRGLPDGVRTVALPEDRGVPGGRNAGVDAVGGEVLFFLDDDAQLGAPDTLARIEERFAAEPDLAVLQPRVYASDGGRPPRDWVPRLRVGDRARSGDVATFWEGAVAIRRTAFDAAGRWPDAFVRAHEGIDLTWRLLDLGYRVHYTGDIATRHPSYATAPYDHSLYFGARNRVWVAHRHLPLPLAALYVVCFALRTIPVLRTPARARTALRGYRDGLRRPCGPRRPLPVKTLWRMTRLGRPPII